MTTYYAKRWAGRAQAGWAAWQLLPDGGLAAVFQAAAVEILSEEDARAWLGEGDISIADGGLMAEDVVSIIISGDEDIYPDAASIEIAIFEKGAAGDFPRLMPMQQGASWPRVTTVLEEQRIKE